MTVRNFGLPMTLRNMRENGAHAVIAKCEACGHEADVNVDALPESVHVPDAGRYRAAAVVAASASQRGPHGTPPNAKASQTSGSGLRTR